MDPDRQLPILAPKSLEEARRGAESSVCGLVDLVLTQYGFRDDGQAAQGWEIVHAGLQG
jgi:hypothetical protein